MPITRNKSKVRVPLFNGGENSTGEVSLVQTPQATLARNVVLDEPGKVIQREGLVRIGDNPDTLISHYTFDASDSTDDKGSNDGTDTSVTYDDGKFGKAALFNGTTSLITVGEDSTIDFTTIGAFVITCWLRPTSDGEGDAGRIFTKGNSYANVHTESSSTVKLNFVVDYSTTDAQVSTSSTIACDETTWTKVEFVHNADKSLDIYINGVKATYGTDTQGVGTIYDDSSDDLIIGNNAAASATFDGMIDDFRIYDGTRAAIEYECDKIYGITRFKVSSSFDELYRVRDTNLEVLDSDQKGWTAKVTTLTADKEATFIQANDQLWILNGTDNPHVMNSSEAVLTRINPALQTTGSGLSDITSGGTYSGTTTSTYEVEIDGTGTPDTFKWKKDSGAYTTTVAITGSAQTLAEGVTVTFAATTGHTSGNIWKIYVFPNEGLGKEESAATGASGNPPKCSFGAWAQNNRMFLSGHLTAALRDYVWFSDTLDPHTWDTTLGTGNFFRVKSGGGGKVTWIQPFKLNELIIYKEDSIWVLDMTGTTPLSDWSLQPLNTKIGCGAGKTVKDVGNDQIFLDNEGFVRLLSRTSFDKLKTSVISGPVQDILDTINIDAISKANAEIIDDKYYLAIPTGAQTECDTVLIWDSQAAVASGVPNGGWTVLPSGTWYAKCMCTYEFGDNQLSLVVGDGRAVSLVYQHDLNTDNGTAITMQIAGPQHDAGNRGTDKIWGPLFCVAEAGEDDTIELFADIDSKGWLSLGTFSLAGEIPRLPIDLQFDLGGASKSSNMFHVKYLGRGKTCRIMAEHKTYNVNVQFNEYELYWEERIMRE